MDELFSFLSELDKLKSVYRKAYISDFTRNENSAGHSWHLAIAILALKDELGVKIDFAKAVKMALVHDICEIGSGDISVYDPNRNEIEKSERDYITSLAETNLAFTTEIQELWEEYEAQETAESRWVKIVDRLLPFMLNLLTEGKTWKEQSITVTQVLKINKIIKKEAPEIFNWMLPKINQAVDKGWLVDA